MLSNCTDVLVHHTHASGSEKHLCSYTHAITNTNPWKLARFHGSVCTGQLCSASRGLRVQAIVLEPAHYLIDTLKASDHIVPRAFLLPMANSSLVLKACLCVM